MSEGALALFEDSGVEPPAQPLARLKRLDFSGNNMQHFHSTGGPVLALMGAAPNLEELSLCRCSLQAVQVQMICLTATQGRLRALSLAGNGRIRPLDLQMSLRLAQWLEFLDVRATISHSDVVGSQSKVPHYAWRAAPRAVLVGHGQAPRATRDAEHQHEEQCSFPHHLSLRVVPTQAKTCADVASTLRSVRILRILVARRCGAKALS